MAFDMDDFNSTLFAALITNDASISELLSFENSSESSLNCSLNSPDCVIDHTKVCIGDKEYCNYTEEIYRELLIEYIKPTLSEWILVCSHIFVFLLGLIGNALVCVAVYSNQSMRTVTNIFIVNLAIADFFVILVCLPPTVLWDVTETWFLGDMACKFVIYFQNVSVAVSILTLTFISIDRWYAICFPLRYKPQTSRAVFVIAIIWLIALLCNLPEFFALHTYTRRLRFDVQLFTQCITSWTDEQEMKLCIIKAVFLYTLPLVLMSFAYMLIVRVLWRSDTIPGHVKKKAYCTRNKIQQFSHGESNSTTIAQLKARRKASKMLVAVVIMFAVCYFPVHALNIYRYTTKEEQSEILTILSLLSHWLCYANSAMNPLIYNFMSGKFRREFKNVLERGHCLTQRTNPRNQHWTSQYRSRYGNDEQEHSFIQSTTHMINVTPSLRRNFGCSVQSCQTSFTNGHNTAIIGNRNGLVVDSHRDGMKPKSVVIVSTKDVPEVNVKSFEQE